MPKDCMSDIAKVEIMNILNSWVFKNIKELEDMKKDPNISKEWSDGMETRIIKVNDIKDNILDFKTCLGEELE